MTILALLTIITILASILMKLDTTYNTIKGDGAIKVRPPIEGGYQPEETYNPIAKPPKQP